MPRSVDHSKHVQADGAGGMRRQFVDKLLGFVEFFSAQKKTRLAQALPDASALFGLFSHPGLFLFSSDGALASFFFTNEETERRDETQDQGQRDSAACDENSFISADELLETVEFARRTCHDWFIIEVALDIVCETAGCLVTTGAVLFQGFHNNAIEVPAKNVDEFRSVGPAMRGGNGQIGIKQGAQ